MNFMNNLGIFIRSENNNNKKIYKSYKVQHLIVCKMKSYITNPVEKSNFKNLTEFKNLCTVLVGQNLPKNNFYENEIKNPNQTSIQ